MDLVTEIKTSVPKEVVYFDHLTMDVVAEGMVVKAKSELFHNWIKSQQALKTGDGELCTYTIRKSDPVAFHNKVGPMGHEFYTPQDKWNYSVPYGLAQIGYGEYFVDEKPNLIWMFSTKLGEGTEVLFKTPISLNNWEDYFTTCCKAIQDIWYRELRRVSITAKFKEILEEPNV